MQDKRVTAKQILAEIGIDVERMAQKVTEGYKQDTSHLPNLLDQVDREIDCFVGDGLYDREPDCEAVCRHSSGASMVVPF